MGRKSQSPADVVWGVVVGNIAVIFAAFIAGMIREASSNPRFIPDPTAILTLLGIFDVLAVSLLILKITGNL